MTGSPHLATSAGCKIARVPADCSAPIRLSYPGTSIRKKHPLGRTMPRWRKIYLLVLMAALIGVAAAVLPTDCPIHFNRLSPRFSLSPTICADVTNPDYQVRPATSWGGSICPAERTVRFRRCECRRKNELPTSYLVTGGGKCEPCSDAGERLWCILGQ